MKLYYMLKVWQARRRLTKAEGNWKLGTIEEKIEWGDTEHVVEYFSARDNLRNWSDKLGKK